MHPPSKLGTCLILLVEGIIELLVLLELLFELLAGSNKDGGSEVISSGLLSEAGTFDKDHTSLLKTFKSVEKIGGKTSLLGFLKSSITESDSGETVD